MDRARVLIVEDEAIIAYALMCDLEAAGLDVVGPFGTVRQTVEALQTASVDVAVLDVNIRDGLVFPVAEKLAERRIPFFFATACNPQLIPPRFANVPRFEKPVTAEALVKTIQAAA